VKGRGFVDRKGWRAAGWRTNGEALSSWSENTGDFLIRPSRLIAENLPWFLEGGQSQFD
jgi:hypothetical protein